MHVDINKAIQRTKYFFGLADNMKGGQFAAQKLDGSVDILSLTFQFLHKTQLEHWLSANLDGMVLHVAFLKI